MEWFELPSKTIGMTAQSGVKSVFKEGLGSKGRRIHIAVKLFGYGCESFPGVVRKRITGTPPATGPSLPPGGKG